MISACRLLWPGVTWRLVVTLVLPLLLLPLPLVWRAPGQLEAEYCDISQISLAALISGVHVLSEARCLYVLLLMAGYWLGELLPIPATALLPVVLFPLLGIMTTAQVLVLSCDVMPYHIILFLLGVKVSVYYLKSSCMLFMGGLMVALAIEHSNLHRNVQSFFMYFKGKL